MQSCEYLYAILFIFIYDFVCIYMCIVCIYMHIVHTSYGLKHICISYVTSVRYVAGINHEARGRAAPSGLMIYSGNVPNRERDISNLCLHEPIAMVNGTKFLVLSP